MQIKRSTLYNPANQTPKEIKDNFLIRQVEFTQIIDGIKENTKNFLLVAQRGMGKTSLLLRLAYEMNNNSEFSNTIPLQFKEEQYNIVSLCTLWESVADELDKINEFEGIAEKLDEAIDNGIGDCFELILDTLEKSDKKIVLLVDNFGDMLDKFTSFEVDELATILNNKYIQLVSASARVIEDTSNYNKTFFEDFTKVTLKGLTKEETETLLSSPYITKIKNAEEIVEKRSTQIEILRRLTGGVPRTMILLFAIFEDDKADIFGDLEHTLDMVTPLYKHRMDDLSPHLQKMVHVMALAWDGVTFEELHKKLRGIESNELHNNLIESEKNSLININPIDGDGYIYQLRERFFNIWYLMRYGRAKNKENVKWLVKFLQVWCTPEELKDRAYKHIQMLQNGGVNPRGAKYMADALADSIESDEILKEQLQVETNKYLEKNDLSIIENEEFKNEDFSFEEKIEYYKTEIAKTPHNSYLYFTLGNIYKEDNKYQKAIVLYNEAIKLDNKYIDAYMKLGYIYIIQKEYDRAIELYSEVIKIDSKFVSAYIRLGIIARIQKEYDKAIEYYNEVIKIDSKDAYTYNSLGNIYRANRKYDVAMNYYKKAIQVDLNYVYSYVNIADIYSFEQEYVESIRYYQKAIEIDSKHTAPYTSLGIIYFSLKKYEEAIYYCEESIKINPKDAYVQNNLGFIYKYQKEYDKAREYYKKAIEINPSHSAANINLAIVEKDKDIALDLIKNVMENNPKIYKEIINIMFYTNEDKEKAINLVDEVLTLEKNRYSNWIKSILRVWGKKYQDSISFFRKAYLEDEENREEVTQYVLLLIARKKYALVKSLFEDKVLSLENKFRPLYYTLMYFMQEEYPTEYSRMGEELRETVDELIDEVDILSQFFEDSFESGIEREELFDTKKILYNLENSPNEYFHDAISFVENYSEKSEEYIKLLDILAGLYDKTFLNDSGHGKLDGGWYYVSVPLYLEAIEIRKEIFGNEHINVIKSYITLADIFKQLSTPPENAVEYYLEAIARMESNLKENIFDKEMFNMLDSLKKNIDKFFFINSDNSSPDLNFKINKIKIENFKQYKSPFTIEFSKQVNIIIGQNAIGKTSLLQVITLALLKENSFDKLTDYSNYITKGKDESQISLSYNKGEKNITIQRDRREIDDNYFIPFVLTYGSNFFTKYDINPSKIVDSILHETIHKDFAHTIFLDYTNEFWNPLSVLEDLAVSTHKKAIEKERILFKTINSFLALEPFELKRANKDNRDYFYFKKEDDSTEFYLSDLSEGYRGNILLITDMVIKILGVGKTPETIEGIILIDEFDKHLHPRWQSKLVDKLKDTFRYIQFIMTTHNPMSVLGRKAEEITMIKEVEGKIIADKGQGTENMDVSSVLLEYFDVDSVVGKPMQDKIKRFNELRVNDDINTEEYENLKQEILNSEFGVLTFDSDYLEYLKSQKRNNTSENRNFDNIGDFL